jgi:hypothetical protein
MSGTAASVAPITDDPLVPASFAADDGISVFWIFGAYANTWVMTRDVQSDFFPG